jgi:non-homologous end joining protein Ku
MKIIKAKMRGQKIEVAEPDEPESTTVVDLMARLQESLEMGKRRGRPTQTKARSRESRATKRRDTA